LPVDSEHNAIFQVLTHPAAVEKLILTATGGPFRTTSVAPMAAVTPAQAIAITRAGKWAPKSPSTAPP
jgi:1-deoxy-D-xylulose-5-phosphate reductoisomerase